MRLSDLQDIAYTVSPMAKTVTPTDKDNGGAFKKAELSGSEMLKTPFSSNISTMPQSADNTADEKRQTLRIAEKRGLRKKKTKSNSNAETQITAPLRPWKYITAAPRGKSAAAYITFKSEAEAFKAAFEAGG